MKRIIAAIGITIAACQPAERQQPANEALEIPVDELGYPTRQPDGSPLTAAYCNTEQARKIYDNIKTCSMIACSQGDKESCEIARTFATQHAPQEERVGAAQRRADKLEGMSYIQARRIILAYGWRPLPGACTGIMSDKTCAEFPEIGNCSGTGLGFCDMHFARQNRCLNVVTVGGFPSGADGDTIVRNVMFRRSPCAKDPNEGHPELQQE